jgi:hypothetical protein
MEAAKEYGLTSQETEEFAKLLGAIRDFRRKNDCGPSYRDLSPVIGRSASTIMTKVETMIGHGLASASHNGKGMVMEGSLNITKEGRTFVYLWEQGWE